MNITAARRGVWVVAIAFVSTITCALLALFVVQGNVQGDVGKTLAAAIVYMLPLLALQAATEKTLRHWSDASRFPVDWIVYGGAKLVIGLASAAVGSALALLLGIVGKWQDLYLPNRMVVVVSVIAACLIRLYGTTRSRLEERNRQLEAKVEAEGRTLRMHEQDFERAREIQEALMPKQLPQIRGCRLAATCQPARTVGGDYYDAIPVSDSSVAITIGDVSGKGMAAALLMSNLQAIVRAFAPSGPAPEELCAKANGLIAGNVASGKYITFFYAVVDTARMQLDYCSAGHNPPLLLHRDGTLETLAEGGPVLGIFPAARYVGGMAELRPGDCLVLFTDGITEAMNAKDEEFGEQRLMDLLSQGPGTADECRQRIMSAVTKFSGGNFHDDATVLVLTVN
ncbi:MAG: PP2C family protein-serine/threonine phosphatase [Bryobacteraceae bacterium]